MRGPRRNPEHPVYRYLNEVWDEDIHGRSPTYIAHVLGLKPETVTAALRNRKDSVAAKVRHLPLDDFGGEGKEVEFRVDSYTLVVHFTVWEGLVATHFEMTEEEIDEAIRVIQGKEYDDDLTD